MCDLIDVLSSHGSQRVPGLQFGHSTEIPKEIDTDAEAHALVCSLRQRYGENSVYVHRAPPWKPQILKDDSTQQMPMAKINSIEILLGEYVLGNSFSMVNRALLLPRRCCLRLESIPLRYGIPLAVKASKVRLLMLRRLCQLNRTVPYGFVRAHVGNGCISMCAQGVFPPVEFGSLLKGRLQGWIEGMKSRIQSTMHAHIHPLAFLAGEIQKEELTEAVSKNYNSGKVFVDEVTVNSLGAAVVRSHKTCAFMQHDRLIEAKQAPCALEEKAGDSHQQTEKMTGCEQQLANLLKFYNLPFQDQSKSGLDFPIRKIKDFVSALKTPSWKESGPNDRSDLFAEVHILDLDQLRWSLLGQGGTCCLEVVEAVVLYVDATTRNKSDAELKKQREKHLRKALVRKSGLENKGGSRIGHEKQILQKITLNPNVRIPRTFPNVQRFYRCEQPILQQSLLMDYCPGRSLDKYVVSNRLTVSVMSLLYLMWQAAHALRFLAMHDVTHLDVKPQNLLIGRSLCLKLSDFGQSYHSAVCALGYQPGFTLPYCAPEIFQRDIPFGPALDAYGFGQTLHEILFGNCLLNSFQVESRLGDKYMNGSGTALQLAMPERVIEIGYQPLLEIVMYLATRCMQSNREMRTLSEWSIITLREAFLLLDKFY